MNLQLKLIKLLMVIKNKRAHQFSIIMSIRINARKMGLITVKETSRESMIVGTIVMSP